MYDSDAALERLRLLNLIRYAGQRLGPTHLQSMHYNGEERDCYRARTKLSLDSVPMEGLLTVRWGLDDLRLAIALYKDGIQASTPIIPDVAQLSAGATINYDVKMPSAASAELFARLMCVTTVSGAHPFDVLNISSGGADGSRWELDHAATNYWPQLTTCIPQSENDALSSVEHLEPAECDKTPTFVMRKQQDPRR